MSTILFDRPLTPGTCEWCGKPCDQHVIACSVACEARVAFREKNESRAIVRVLKLWRKHRGRKGTPGEGAIGEAAALIDAMLKADRQRVLKLTAERDAAARPPEPDRENDPPATP